MIGAFVAVLLVVLLIAAAVAAVAGGGSGGGPPEPGQAGAALTATGASPASALALDDIPDDFYELYSEAGAVWAVDWSVLAAIGKVECDHGRARLDGCRGRGTVNEAGARGPMQFLGSTWRADASVDDPDVAGDPIPDGVESAGYATDGNEDGIADPWDPPDAIHAAARMLAANGAPDDYDTALDAYNPAATYSTDVLDQAALYRAADNDDTGYRGESGEVPLSDVVCRGGSVTSVHIQLLPAVDALYYQAPDALCGGGYRDPQRQIELRRQNCGTSDYAIYQMPSSQCSPPTARPGASQHERGLAIDLTCEGTLIESRTNPCFVWLADNAANYGLYNLPSEPWHWSVNGN